MKQIREISALEENFRKKVSAWLEKCKNAGVEIFLTETFRPQERQNELFAQGRTAPGKIVTWTKNSMHTKKLAVDIAFAGAELYPRNHKKWEKIAEIGKDLGIDWSFDLFKVEKCHFQCDGSKFKEKPVFDGVPEWAQKSCQKMQDLKIITKDFNDTMPTFRFAVILDKFLDYLGK